MFCNLVTIVQLIFRRQIKTQKLTICLKHCGQLWRVWHSIWYKFPGGQTCAETTLNTTLTQGNIRCPLHEVFPHKPFLNFTLIYSRFSFVFLSTDKLRCR